MDDADPREKRYVLTMYPYPSGDLHIGHWYAATGPDIVARLRRMQGYNVMFPMGFDSFGLPAENAAIDRGIPAATWTANNIERMRGQFKTMGCMFDWSRELATSDPDYYRWTQWIFIKLFEAGLAYKAMAPVDWCPKDKVVLAREQVEGADRHCWRCGTPVEKRDLEQWFFRITKYADELLDFSDVDYPEPIRLMQTNWIGRSEGAEIDFPVDAEGVEPIRVFTTRPDTLFGATFMVLAPEHPAVARLTTDERRAEVEAYVADARRQTEIDRLSEVREKSGVFIGAYARNPLTDERIPIWIADYVLPGYGTGAIMAVPAHDERDFAFARRYDLPIRYVVAPAGEEVDRDSAFVAHTADEVLLDSGEFTGMPAADAIRAITARLEERGLGKAAVTYRQRDWLVSRQRYWGAPDPGGLLRRARRAAGAGGGAAGAPAAGRRVPARRRLPAADHRIVRLGHLPGMRRARAPRDGHHGHVRRLGLVFPALLLPGRGRRGVARRGRGRLDAHGPVHRRRGARRHAPALLPLHGQGAARHRPAGLRRADPRAAQPGPDPGRRPPAHEQVARQRRRTRTS